MMQSSSIAASDILHTPQTAAQYGALAGFMIVSILPALFWTALIAGAAYVFGGAPGVHSLCILAASIAAFLGLVFAALRTRAD